MLSDVDGFGSSSDDYSNTREWVQKRQTSLVFIAVRALNVQRNLKAFPSV